MGISVDIDHRLGDFHLHARFESQARLTALFGQSGSGKTSIVNAIAGLLRPARASIVVDGVTLTDTQRGLFTPTHKRHIGYVFQEARLFPHLSVRQNLLYAQWFGGRKASPGASFENVVDMLGVAPILERYPSRLSGGEKQRVAIGRALLSHPRLLLMDEPLASLDDARKQEILPYIERLRDEAGVPIIYVSHSPVEVRRLADFVVVMDAGNVRFAGPPGQALALSTPASETPDMNVLDVLAVEQRPGGMLALQTKAGMILAQGGDPAPRRVALRTGDILMSLDPLVRTSALNVLEGRVACISGGAATSVRVRVGEAEIQVTAPTAFVQANGLREGDVVYLLVSAVTLL
ncbi:MAG: molybdenum ABC transporter ATP-binding protein [Beijerinckiaceae bacterium]|nr:molybdenum ABC transporter ATP-binding protein [Beijerinckiaceae bacterium]